jgi:hypothetical protein
LPRVFNSVRALACMQHTLSLQTPCGSCRCMLSLRSTQPATAKNRVTLPRAWYEIQISSETAWLSFKNQQVCSQLYSILSTISVLRRPDSVAIDWTNKTLCVLEFNCTSDQRQDYREHGESRVRAQHNVLIKSLEKVAGEAEGESAGWKVKLLIFVGGTSDLCMSKHSTTISRNWGLSN